MKSRGNKKTKMTSRCLWTHQWETVLLFYFIFSCYNGWTGATCDECVVLPGCQNGTCMDQVTNKKEPNTCHCNAMWEGHLCDEPKCE